MADFRHETERLVLRDWRVEDWAPFWNATNTPAVMRWLGGVLEQGGMDAARGRLETKESELSKVLCTASCPAVLLLYCACA